MSHTFESSYFKQSRPWDVSRVEQLVQHVSWQFIVWHNTQVFRNTQRFTCLSPLSEPWAVKTLQLLKCKIKLASNSHCQWSTSKFLSQVPYHKGVAQAGGLHSKDTLIIVLGEINWFKKNLSNYTLPEKWDIRRRSVWECAYRKAPRLLHNFPKVLGGKKYDHTF